MYRACESVLHCVEICQSVSVGQCLSVSVCRSVAVGQWLSVSGCRSVSVGQWLSVSGCRSVAVGQWLSVSGCRSVAVGQCHYALQQTLQLQTFSYTFQDFLVCLTHCQLNLYMCDALILQLLK